MNCLSCNNLVKFLGSLAREEDVLEWLIENKSTGDDNDVIEDVSGRTLQTLISNADNLAVFVCKLNLIDKKNMMGKDIDWINTQKRIIMNDIIYARLLIFLKFYKHFRCKR